MSTELPVITLEPDLEQLLTNSLVGSNAATPGLEPGLAERMQRRLAEAAQRNREGHGRGLGRRRGGDPKGSIVIEVVVVDDQAFVIHRCASDYLAEGTDRASRRLPQRWAGSLHSRWVD